MFPNHALIDFKSSNKSLVDTCLEKYPSILEDVYKETRPKAKLKDIVNDDIWRYEELPVAVKAAGKLSKEQLARLVKWKM